MRPSQRSPAVRLVPAVIGCKLNCGTRALIVHCRLYISLAVASARLHPARLPCASSRLARARVAANCAWARSLARLIEAGVGWRSICAPIDCGPNGPAFGLPADCRTASSNCAILALQGPACADSMLRPKAAKKKTVAIRRTNNVLRRDTGVGWAFESELIIQNPCHSRFRSDATIRKVSSRAS
jgi:hypothetical protein